MNKTQTSPFAIATKPGAAKVLSVALRLMATAALIAGYAVTMSGCAKPKSGDTKPPVEDIQSNVPEGFSAKGLVLGKPTPNLTMVALNDKDAPPFILNNQKDKVVLLVFWATWCMPCLAEVPIFNKLYKAYKDKGLRIAAVSFDFEMTDEKIMKAVKKYKMAYPVYRGKELTRVMYHAENLPTTIVLDRKGNLSKKLVGAKSYEYILKTLKDAGL